MAKTPTKPPVGEDDETPEMRALTDDDVLPGETIEEWALRKNREEGIGPDGRYTYVSRHPTRVDEDMDPNMGGN